MGREIDLLDDESGTKTRTFHKGGLLYKEGQESSVAYIVKQGRVALFTVLGNRRVGLGERGPGDIVGEMELMTNERRGSSAEALESQDVGKTEGGDGEGLVPRHRARALAAPSRPTAK